MPSPSPATRADTTVATAPTSRSGTGRAARQPDLQQHVDGRHGEGADHRTGARAAVGDGDPHEGDRHHRPRAEPRPTER